VEDSHRRNRKVFPRRHQMQIMVVHLPHVVFHHGKEGKLEDEEARINEDRLAVHQSLWNSRESFHGQHEDLPILSFVFPIPDYVSKWIDISRRRGLWRLQEDTQPIQRPSEAKSESCENPHPKTGRVQAPNEFQRRSPGSIQRRHEFW